jgi:nuclear cap-binding protein subunit 1
LDSNGFGKNGYFLRRFLKTLLNSIVSRVADLNLAEQHPKRAFIRRALEFEIRLSYHDRILKTLPEAMQVSEAKLIPPEPPGPHFEYDELGRSQFVSPST